MFSRRPGERFNRGRIVTFAGGAGTPEIPTAFDARLLSTASDLQSYWRIENRLTHRAALATEGSAPPAITLLDNLTTLTDMRIEVEDSTHYRWGESNELGWVWVAQNQVIPAGSSVVLSGHTVGFAAGAYNNTHKYSTSLSNWGGLAAAGTDLDNSTVAATLGFIYERWGMGGKRAAAVQTPNLATSYMGNQGNCPVSFAGNNHPFHVFEHSQLWFMGIGSLSVALWSASSQTDTLRDNIYALAWGSASGGGLRFTSQRRSAVSSGAVVAKDFAFAVDMSPHIFEQEYDGTNVIWRIDGMPVGAAQAWSSDAIACNRYVEGAIKLGGGGVVSQPFKRMSEKQIYNRNLTGAERDAVYKTIAQSS